MKRPHRVSVKLRTTDIFDVESRVGEVREIRDWVGEKCGWDPDLFEFKIHSSGSIIDIWLENEEDAIMCTLRWA